MSPEGKIKKVEEFEEEHQKSMEELKKEGFIELSQDEHDRIQSLPEEQRMAAIKAMRFVDVREAAQAAQAAERRKTAKKKNNKNRKKMIKSSRKKNRK